MKLAIGILLATGVTFWGAFELHKRTEAHEAAKLAGFLDANDQTAAGRANIQDPKEWAKERVRREKRATEAQEEEDLPINACVLAELAVKANLRAPTTAKFPNCWEYQTRISHDRQTVHVIGHVDAQNAFGVLLRNNFAVTLRRKPGARLGLEVISTSLD